MSLRKALLVAPLLALPAGAMAQPVSGLYIGIGAGWNQPQTSDLERRNGFNGLPAGNAFRSNGRAIFNSGFGGVLSLGYGFGNGFRAEIEGNYRQNDVEKIGGFGAGAFGKPNGFQRSYGAMGNIFYDLDLANFGLRPSVIQPYVGVGAGYVWNEWHRVRAGSTSGLGLLVDDTDGRFAYQGIIGAAMPLTMWNIPGLSLTAEYRFLGTLDSSLQTEVRNPLGQVVSRGKLDVENMNHSVMLGLRYAFNQPRAAPPPPMAAAPAPAPAAAPARSYLVFFDWNRADLTARAREIIAEAAQNVRRVQSTQIEVAGHADRSGTPQYNQRLSQRRAETVAAELVRNGVGRNEITVTGFGESRPLVQTADGVREPQNRRVEIVLR
jgi:outer membrane protein OmpA-like peptidoglycan-associated protein